MKRILVIGMSDTLGGVETYLYNLIKTINKQQYKFDFLVIGQDNKSVFEKEINEIIGDGKNHFYYCPNLKKEYLKNLTDSECNRGMPLINNGIESKAAVKAV